MINQWLTPRQITTLDGMPGSIQGVHKKAKREGWQKRPHVGKQGPGVEYFVIYSQPSKSGYRSTIDSSEQEEQYQLLDQAILSRVIEAVEILLKKKNIHLSPNQKAKIILMLYKICVKNNEVDIETISDAIELIA